MKKQAAQARDERRAATARLIKATGLTTEPNPPAPARVLTDLRKKQNMRYRSRMPVAAIATH